MMSVHFWGEPVTTGSSSTWKLLVANAGDQPSTLLSWGLTFFGTEEDPQPGIEIAQVDPAQVEPVEPAEVEPVEPVEPAKPDTKRVQPVPGKLEDILEEAAATTEGPNDEEATQALEDEDDESHTATAR